MEPIENYLNNNSGRVFILGNGPSLADYDLSLLDPAETMTMNRSWREVPGAAYHCCSGDLTGIRKPPQRVLFLGQPSQYPQGVPVRATVILVQTETAGTKIIPKKKNLDVPPELDLRNGWPPTHCGLFAIYAAWWLGFREVYLLGYDGYGTHYTTKGYGDNHFPDHEKLVPEFRRYVDILLNLAPDFQIFNCNPNNEYKNLPVAFYEDLW